MRGYTRHAVGTDPECDQPAIIIYVGQDKAGHWLVQDNASRLEGRFVSFAAAMSNAWAQRDLYHAAVEVAIAPLIPLVSFVPAAGYETAMARAA
ncbi:hypothetical protein [Sphingomonas sp. Leaf38]|uniref:hypothetical protein n=1 Tax=Sphingomonas sp. Leaf38 TaxID=1736217 RepID=UPI0006FEDBB6|nr:hypothetical protein [Sphingomonas sp. Leaf38]KQN32905.1 hypothetical protein ASE88_02790 [Sphingomonas sp. Leaf38]